MEFKYDGHSKKSGVYKITNTTNGKIYIGSAKEFKRRARGHLSSLKNNKHQNKHLQASFNKHGSDVFLFEVIEVVPGDKTARTTREQLYIDCELEDWEKCFNFKKKTVEKDRSCGSKTPEATRKKRSDSMKKKWAEDPEYRKFQSEYQSKKTKELWKDPEYREAHIKAMDAFYDSPRSEELRRKVSKRMTGRVVTKETREKTSKSVSKANVELWKNPVYRKKVIEGRKKSWANDDARKKAAAKRFREISRKTYKLRNPQGKVVTIVDMTAFCAASEVLLVTSTMSKVARGLKEFYKGWTKL